MATKSMRPVTFAEKQLTEDAVELLAIASALEETDEDDPNAESLRNIAHRSTQLAKLLHDTDARTRKDPSLRRRKK